MPISWPDYTQKSLNAPNATLGGEILQLNTQDEVMGAAAKFIDRVVDFMPKWLRGGKLEQWLLKAGLDENTYQSRIALLEAFKDAINSELSGEDARAAREKLLDYTNGRLTLNAREIWNIVGRKSTITKALQDKAAQNRRAWKSFIAKIKTDEEKLLPSAHAYDCASLDLKDTISKSTDTLNTLSAELISGSEANPEGYEAVADEGQSVSIYGALFRDLHRATFLFETSEGKVSPAIDKDDDRNSVNLIRQAVIHAFRDLFSREEIAAPDRDKALKDFSMIVHQGLFADVIDHHVYPQQSVIPMEAEDNFGKSRVQYTFRAQKDGSILVSAVSWKRLQGIQIPGEGNYYCDPRSSFEKKTIELEFTPAYLRKEIDGKPHFEVLNAVYDRKLAPIKMSAK